MTKNLKVIKRDGSVRDFDQEKIAKVTKAAGLENEEADKLAQGVKEWAEGLNKEQITSLEIRDRVSEELKLLNSYASRKYDWYQEMKTSGKV